MMVMSDKYVFNVEQVLENKYVVQYKRVNIPSILKFFFTPKWKSVYIKEYTLDSVLDETYVKKYLLSDSEVVEYFAKLDIVLTLD